MRKTTLFKTILLLLILLVNVSVRADDQLAYTISFVNSETADATAAVTTSNFISNLVTGGSSYISSCTQTNNVYKGVGGAKLSSSGTRGKFTIALSASGQVNATKIVVNAKQYSTDTEKIAVNGTQTPNLTNTPTDYTFTLDGSILSAISIESITKRSYVYYIKVYVTAAPSCTTPSFSFASSTVNKLTTDAAFTNTFTSDNTSTKVWSSTNEAVATVNSSGLVTIVGAGSTNIKVNQVEDGTYCAVVDASYALNVTNASAPAILVTETVSPFSANVNSSSQSTIHVNASNLTGDITLALSGANQALFSLDKTSISPTSGSVADEVVTITYSPTAAGAHSATLTLSSAGATNVTKSLTGTAVYAEPTNQPTGLTATANSSSQITVTWTDASGTQAPTGYLVKATVDPSSPTAPVDGTAEIDGTLVKNITQGTQQAVFTGLSGSTTYNFSIWPYTNSATAVNYKTDGTVTTTSATTETPLGVPVATTASDVTTTSFKANWNAAAAATGYEVSVYTKSGTTASDLFISEYGEGSSNNKYIEIFNGTDSSVDLSTYVLKQSYNGTGWPTDTNSPYYLPLTGTLASNDVFIISTSDANSTILSQADMKLTYSTSQGGKTISFTGNDALGLFKNDVLIDVFGDPSSSSTIPVAGYSTYGQDHTIVRKSTITAGNANWANSSGTNTTDSEWVGYAQDTWTYIGSHTMGSGLTSIPISGSPFTVTETSKAVSGLNPATTYYYTVVAKNAHATSSASNEISVTTDNHLSVSGDVNASSLIDCPTCDVAVGDGAHLTVDAAKTFNAVTVQPTGKLTVSDGVTLTAPVTIKSTSEGTATAIGAVTGSSNIEQYLPGDGRSWWYLSSPVTGATSTLFGSDKVGQYDEATTSYSSPFSTATNLVAGTGYVVKRAVTTAGTYTFAGTLNNGDITLNPTRTGTTAGKRGFNLIGNPYPSYLDWNAAYADAATSNIRNAIWYRTYSGGQMTFHTYADADGVPEITTGIIPPAQAFWIRVNADGSNGAITFKNTHRSHAGATANPLKAPKINDRPRVRLQVSNGVNTDEALIVAKSYASNGIDNYDIEKMSNSNVEIPEIYSLLNNQEMVINSLNGFTAGQQIALGFRPGKAGEFTISSTQFENVPSEVKVVLKDQLTGVETELNDGVSYSFSSDATTTDNRFVVSFRAPGTTTGTDIIGDASLQVYAQASEIVITSAALTGSSISVFSATGQRLFSGLANNNREVVTGNFTPGVYFVKVNAVVKKVSVK